MAYDPARGVTILFGGWSSLSSFDGETWEWNGSVWTRRSTVGPPPRTFTSMAFDSARGATVLFGGKTAGGGLNGVADTWEWNGTAWNQRAAGGPPARLQHAIAYDSIRNVTVLFGGSGTTGTLLGDTWEWNGANWSQRLVAGPTPRRYHSMAFDPHRGVTVLFGGVTGADRNGETWEWDGTSWTQRVIGGPSARLGHAMVYDTARRAAVMFGGSAVLPPGGPAFGFVGDTWQLGALASYIYVPVHGQLPQLACPSWVCTDIPERPQWMNDSACGLEAAFRTINPQPGGTGFVTSTTVFGDWMDSTRYGFGEIVSSRFLYASAELNGGALSPLARDRMRAAAARLEDSGRKAAASASRWSAFRLADTVKRSIDSARGSGGTPVFVDLVGHSRGGAVAADILRRIQSSSTPTQPVYFSLTLLDAIDPSGGPTHQLNELAGDLLNDPAIASELLPGRTTNFVAESAFFGASQQDFGWYPAGIAAWMVNTALLQSDAALVAAGYPHGRVRQTSQSQAQGQVVAGTTHGTIAQAFALTSTEYPSPAEFSFAFSTRIGQLLRNPTQPLGPLLTSRCPGCPFGPRADPPLAEFVADPAFSVARSTVADVQSALASPEIAAMLTPNLEPVPTILAAIAAENWLGDSSWNRSAGTATCTPTDVHVPAAESVWQRLDPASLSQSRLRFRVKGVVEGSGVGSVSLHGDGLAFARVLDVPGAFDIDEIITRSTSASSGAPDIVSVGGGPIRLALVSVSPGCRPDVNGDGSVSVQDIFDFLNRWFAGDPGTDFNTSGSLSVQDIFDFLNAWFAGCA